MFEDVKVNMGCSRVARSIESHQKFDLVPGENHTFMQDKADQI